MSQPADASTPSRPETESEYETLSGLLHAYRTPVAIILFGIMVSLILFFATLVGQTRDKENAFRSYALARVVELDGAMATLDVELRQLAQVIDSGLTPDDALNIFRTAGVRNHIPVVRDMGIVEGGRLRGALDSEIGQTVAREIGAQMARDVVPTGSAILPLPGDDRSNSRFAIILGLPERPELFAYVASDLDVMLASPAGPADPLWVVINIADRAPTHALVDTAQMQVRGDRPDMDIQLALDSAPFMVRWAAAAPFSEIRATILPRRSFLMQPGALPWVVLASALFATLTIGAISLKDARRSDEIRREVTRKTAELSRSNAIIAAKNAELDRFAAHASHDLQAPLRAMKGISSLLVERQLDLDERSRDMLERINRGADRAQRLVQDLLTYTRADRQEARVKFIEPEALISEIEELLGAAITDSNAQLNWQLDTPIYGDPFLLVRMLQNLVGNAIKYCGDAEPEVHIHARRVGDNVLISVTDNGIGIDKAYFGRIFQVFERLHGGDTYEGTGIGLALCQRAAELHGGDIAVTSTPGEGSCFTVRLPGNLATKVEDYDNSTPQRAVSNDR
ncbi:ATP-binding protein [uncultured Maricaulis sp.]|uniref:sensor histidine kinase n=1 Tax=uncultured Maricaulis sp. TaxID=174710 RepID=UPI00262663F1|nr:ATP-binding protein [uncultured Maricaulis sp.]